MSARANTGAVHFPAPPADLAAAVRWVYEGPFGGRRYDWPQCRFCGRADGHDCAPVACPLCASVQCHGNGSGDGCCNVCHYGWLPGWSHGYGDERLCGRKGCQREAVAKAPRVKRVCLQCAAVTSVQLGGRRLLLPEYVAEQVRERDRGGQWQHWTPLLPDGSPAPRERWTVHARWSLKLASESGYGREQSRHYVEADALAAVERLRERGYRAVQVLGPTGAPVLQWVWPDATAEELATLEPAPEAVRPPLPPSLPELLAGGAR